ncbi:MAG: T9SS type A sorting domain-containing protein [Bacteroidota bacterium]|nr:T9SS type A sorting domain-containing protein [Bacteroidota bacterium]
MKMKTSLFVALFALMSLVCVKAQNYSDDFESSSDVPSGWRIANFTPGGQHAALSINTESTLTGVNALEINVTENVSNWFENVAGYSFPANIGDEYIVSFDAKASSEISIPVKLNTDGNEGQTEIISQTLNLTADSQHFSLTTTSGCTKTMNYLFWFELNGKDSGTKIYIDNFSLKNKLAAGIKGASQIGISYYPNPAKNFVFINGGKVGDAVTIYSLAGQLVLSSVIDGKSISLENIKAGAYLLKVGNTTQKLMIEK